MSTPKDPNARPMTVACVSGEHHDCDGRLLTMPPRAECTCACHGPSLPVDLTHRSDDGTTISIEVTHAGDAVLRITGPAAAQAPFMAGVSRAFLSVPELVQLSRLAMWGAVQLSAREGWGESRDKADLSAKFIETVFQLEGSSRG